ncbi:hypothetical protein DSECCO2_298090 [anaerobic digester metagenome]
MNSACLYQLVVPDCILPFEHIIHVGHDGACRIWLREAQVFRIGKSVLILITGGPVRNDLFVAAIIRIIHLQWLENIILQKLFIGKPGSFFNDVPQQKIG